MIQSLRDREILDSFLHDGNEISTFNRIKTQYKVEQKRRVVIHQAFDDLEIH